MGKQKSGNPKVTTSVTISPEFYDLCLKHNISFSEAIRTGISLLLAERGEKDYDNNLNLYRKMQNFKLNFEELSLKFQELQEKSGVGILIP